MLRARASSSFLEITHTSTSKPHLFWPAPPLRADETYRARVRVSSREYVGMIVGRAGQRHWNWQEIDTKFPFWALWMFPISFLIILLFQISSIFTQPPPPRKEHIRQKECNPWWHGQPTVHSEPCWTRWAHIQHLWQEQWGSNHFFKLGFSGFS